MLVAQALGEYAALGVLVERFNEASISFEDVAGQWAVEGMIALVVAVVVWRVVLRSRL